MSAVEPDPRDDRAAAPPPRLPAQERMALALDAADAHLDETFVAREHEWQGSFLHVRRDRVRLRDGHESTREYVVHPGAVMVVPLLDDDHAVMERQFRYPLAGVVLEFPAGKIDAGEPTFDAIRRELREETGYAAAQWARLGVLHVACAYSTEGIELWLARGLTLGERSLDAGEQLDVVTMPLERLERLAARGELTDSKTLAGLWWWQRWRNGKLPQLAWRAGTESGASAASTDAARSAAPG